MKNAVKNVAASAKTFVIKHKTPIVVTAAVVATVVVMTKARDHQVELHDGFLAERGLTDDFANWFPTETNV